MSQRINCFNVSRFDEKDGVMTVTAIARHVGPLIYRSDSGSRVEFVPPDLIRGLDSDGRPHIAGLAGATVTSEHPVSLISYDDSLRQQVEVGRVKPKVKVYKDDRAEVEIEVYDSKTQDDIRAGRKRGLSVGYQVSVVKQDGEWNGIKYGYVQQAPWKVDHVAIVAHPRAPEALITRYDSDDHDIAWHVDDSISTNEDAMPRNIAIGDEVFSVSDDNLANQILMLLAQKRSLENQVEQMADEMSEGEDEGESEGYMDSDDETEEYTDSTEGSDREDSEEHFDKGPGCPGPGNCLKGSKVKAKKETQSLNKLGKGSGNAERQARIEQLKRKQAAKQKLKKAAEGSGPEYEMIAAKAASGKGVKGMNVAVPKGSRLSDVQDVERLSQKLGKEFEARKKKSKKKDSEFNSDAGCEPKGKTMKKKPYMEEDEEMMDSQEFTSNYEDSEDHTDSDIQLLLDRIDALEAELSVAKRILDSQESHEDSEEDHTDALETAVQNRLDSLFAVYEDAKDYLPADFKLDGSMTAPDVMKAAVLNFDSEIELNSDSAIEGAYSFMKRHWNRDGVRMLQDSVDRAVLTPVRTDAAAIRQARMDEDYQRGRKSLKQSR